MLFSSLVVKSTRSLLSFMEAVVKSRLLKRTLLCSACLHSQNLTALAVFGADCQRLFLRFVKVDCRHYVVMRPVKREV